MCISEPLYFMANTPNSIIYMYIVHVLTALNQTFQPTCTEPACNINDT